MNSSTKTKLIGTVLGMAFVCSIATLQFVFVLGIIEAKNYIVPSLLGSLIGFTLSFWYAKLQQTKEELHENHERLKFVLDKTGIGMWDFFPQSKEVKFDAQWCQLIGYELSEIEQSFAFWKTLIHPDDLQSIFDDLEKHTKNKTQYYSNVHRMRHKKGHWVYILDSGKIIERDKANNPLRMTGTHLDITHLKEVEHQLEASNKKLKQLSLQDGLTGLQNRRALDEYLLHQWAHLQRDSTPFSLLMIDIDCFKQFNDFYGHIIGDECLQRVALTLQAIVKRPNDIVARYGGEEFLLGLSGTTKQDALNIAETIRHDIEALNIPHKNSICGAFVTVSIGVSSCDSHTPCRSSENAVLQADQALYIAKKRGRNQVATH